MFLKSYEIAAAAVLVLTLLSLVANQRLQAMREIPMQWGFDGKPTWFASRPLALSFTPMIAAAMLSAVAAKTAFLPNGTVTLAAISLTLICVHVFYLWMVARYAAR